MRAAKDFLEPGQRAYIEGELGTDNVADVLRFFTEKVPDKHKKYIILIDFTAAFSSINHAFMWEMLEHIHTPKWYIDALKTLFLGVSHSLVWGGKHMKHSTVNSGIKQGDPCSPLVFIIMIDVLMWDLRRMVGGGIHRAYADDIACCVSAPHEIQMVISCLKKIELASGISVNKGKNSYPK